MKDISELTFRDLFNNYKDSVVKLHHSVVDSTTCVTLSDIKNLISNVTMTIPEFLIENGNKTLPSSNIEFVITDDEVVYTNTWQSILSDVKPVKLGTHHNTDWLKADKVDLLLSYTETQFVPYRRIFDSSLFSVNGLLHRPSLSESGITLIDGAKSGTIGDDTKLGIYSFEKITDTPLEVLDIDSSMLSNGTSDAYKDNCNLKLGMDFEGKSVILSLGGYMHILDPFVRVVNQEEGIINLDFSKYPLMERHYEMSAKIDTSALKFDFVNDDREHIVTSSIMNNNEYIESLIDLSQSFIILVDAPLYVETSKLEPTGLTGVFTKHGKMYCPAVSQRGVLQEYTTRSFEFSEREWLDMIYVRDTKIPNYMFHTSTWLTNLTVRNSLVSAKPYLTDDLTAFKIGCSRVK